MSTTIQSGSQNDLKIRFKETYVSEGLNKKLNGVVPPGIIRGGILETTGAGLNVRLNVDALGDSIYSYIDGDGNQFTFRQNGLVTLDLTAVANTDVYIALYVEYVIGVTPTVVEWRAYTIAELTTTPVAEAGEVIVVGRVNVPAAGPIPSTDILPELRQEAGLEISTGLREWQQVITNSDFGLSIDGATDLGPYVGAIPGWSLINGGTNYITFIDQSAPLSGLNALAYQADGVGAILDTTAGESMTWAAVKSGDMVKVAVDIRGVTWTMGAAGFFGVRLSWYDADYQFISNIDAAGIDSTYSGTFSYEHFENILEAPATARWARLTIVLNTDSVIPAASSEVVLDNVKMWVKRDPFDLDARDRDVDFLGSEKLFNTISLGPLPTVPNTETEFISGTVYRQNVGATAGVGAGELLQFLQEGLKGHVSTNPIKAYLTQMVGAKMRFEHAQDSESAREIPHIQTYGFNNAGNKTLSVAHSYGTPTLQTTVGSIRLYQSPLVQNGIVASGVEITQNCFWDESTSLWNREETGYEAFGLAVVSGSIRIYTAPSGAATWADSAWRQAATDPFLEISLETDLAGLILNGLGTGATFDVATGSFDFAAGDGWWGPSGVQMGQQTIVKAHGRIVTDGAGGILASNGYNFTAAISGTNIDITYVNVLANSFGTVVVQGHDAVAAANEAASIFGSITTGFTVYQRTFAGAVVDLSTTLRHINFIVYGESPSP